MATETQTAERMVAVETPHTPDSDGLPFRPLTGCGLIAWGLAGYCGIPRCLRTLSTRHPHLPAVHVSPWACSVASPRDVLRMAARTGNIRSATRFFWNIFGFGALGLWLVLATWLSVYLVLQRFALLKLGPVLGAVAAPFLWTGVEYFRSELYYLRILVGQRRLRLFALSAACDYSVAWECTA
jgi:hypothetical protein